MKKLLCCLLAICCLSGGLLIAADFPDQQQHAYCAYCGMSRIKFAHSRMLVEYDNGRAVATCSLHCAAIEFAKTINMRPGALKVGDFASGELIDAETARWVIGGEKPGVMTMRGKWAFADKAAAAQFVSSHGGRIADIDQALKAAFEDMYQDTLMIRKKRQMKMQQTQSGNK